MESADTRTDRREQLSLRIEEQKQRCMISGLDILGEIHQWLFPMHVTFPRPRPLLPWKVFPLSIKFTAAVAKLAYLRVTNLW